MTTKPPYLTLVSPEESEREEHAKPCSPGVGTLTLRRERCHDQTSPDTTEFDQDEALSRNLPALFASLPESFWAELESPKSTRITWQAASQHGTRELTTARGTTLTVIDPDALLSTPFEELGVHDAMHRLGLGTTQGMFTRQEAASLIVRALERAELMTRRRARLLAPLCREHDPLLEVKTLFEWYSTWSMAIRE